MSIAHSPSNTNTTGSNYVVQSGIKTKNTEHRAVGQYFLGDQLGKGLFGVVFQGLNSNNGEFVAVKRLNLEELNEQKVANITQEIEVFKRLTHPNNVKVYDAIRTNEYLYLVLELVEGGSAISLRENLGSLPENLVAKYIYKCLKGLKYLHDEGIVHNDVKGVNVLVTKDGEVKIADCVQPKLQNNSALTIGQPYWLAPEVIQKNAATPKTDVWSLGCTVIELLTGTPPYSNLASMAAIIQIMKDPHPPLPEGISPELASFLLSCLEKNVDKRSTVKDLLEQPWIKNAMDPDDEEEEQKEDKQDKGILSKSVLSAGDSEVEEIALNDNEEHLMLNVHLDIPELVDSTVKDVTLYVFEDTPAWALVEVALRKAEVIGDSSQFWLTIVDVETLEERRFHDLELPKVAAMTLWEYGGEFKFTVKRKSPPIKMGYLRRKNSNRWARYFTILDMEERYIGFYDKKPADPNQELAKHVIFSFHLVESVSILDDIPNGLAVSLVNGKREYYQAESPEEMISWVNEIRYACGISFILLIASN